MVKSRTQKRKKILRRKRIYTRRTRKQRGGVKPLNTLRFQYTKDEERGAWVDALYPIVPSVLQSLKEIDWSTFRFEGETLIEVEAEPDDNFRQNVADNTTVVAPVVGTTKRSTGRFQVVGLPYHIFGGSACELWNQAYPEAGNLHETTDPTIDIDIKIATPYCTIEGEHSDDGQLLWVDEDGNYTPLADSYTRWIYEIGLEIARRLSPHFSSNYFVAPDPDEMYETSLADTVETIGPILVTRTRVNKMIKTQLSTKLKSGYADHFMEFVVTTNESFEQNKNYLKGTLLNGIYVENVYDLLKGQLQGIRDRREISEPFVHKLINHYGRLLYLAKLHEYIVRTTKQEQGVGYYRDIIEFINQAGFEPSRGCQPRIGCSLENFVTPLCKIRNFNSAYGKCAVPAKLNNARKNMVFTENNINEE